MYSRVGKLWKCLEMQILRGNVPCKCRTRFDYVYSITFFTFNWFQRGIKCTSVQPQYISFLLEKLTYCMGVKSMASGLTIYTKAILFTPCHYILFFWTVIKCIAYTIFNQYIIWGHIDNEDLTVKGRVSLKNIILSTKGNN